MKNKFLSKYFLPEKSFGLNFPLKRARKSNCNKAPNLIICLTNLH